MKQDCEICCGRGTVRLPIYRPFSAVPLDGSIVLMEESSREYACPECGDSVKEDRVVVLDAHSMVDSRVPPDAMPHAERSAARRLVEMLLDGGYISFERGKLDSQYLRYPIIATLGVVSKGRVASLEERAAKTGAQMAQAAADEAIKEIDNWGSYYNHSNILKRDARRFIIEAVRHVTAKWSKPTAFEQSEREVG